MDKNVIIYLFLAFAGLFSILGSILNWDFFFESRKAQTFVKLFGRKGARIFYGVLGLSLILFAYYIIKVQP